MRWKYFEIQGFSEATAGFLKTFENMHFSLKTLQTLKLNSVKFLFINFHDRNSEMSEFPDGYVIGSGTPKSEFQVGREEERRQARVSVGIDV